MANARSTFIQTGIRQRSLRKHCRVGRATELVFVLATGMMLALGGAAQAQDWDAGNTADDPAVDAPTGGNGNWEEGGTSNLWDLGATNGAFTSGDNATFGAPGGYTVTVDAAGVTVNDIAFTANNVAIDGPGALTISGTVSSTVGNNAVINANITGASRLLLPVI